jgi:hypothetical protein
MDQIGLLGVELVSLPLEGINVVVAFAKPKLQRSPFQANRMTTGGNASRKQ